MRVNTVLCTGTDLGGFLKGSIHITVLTLRIRTDRPEQTL